VQAVGELMSRVQARIQAVANDDTESLSALLNIQDVLIFCYGMDEDEIGSVPTSWTKCRLILKIDQ
jgi:hypothetical protein